MGVDPLQAVCKVDYDLIFILLAIEWIGSANEIDHFKHP
jgi:hypothetical protein